MSGWGGLPVVFVGLFALLLLGSAVARGANVTGTDPLTRLLAWGGILGTLLFGTWIVVKLLNEAAVFVAGSV